MKNNRNTIQPGKWLEYTAAGIAVVLCVFQLLMASPLFVSDSATQSCIFWTLLLAYYLLMKHHNTIIGIVFDIVLVIFTFYSGYTLLQMRSNLVAMGGLYTTIQTIVSILQVAVALYIGYRRMGKVLPTLCVVFLVYALWGRHIPGMFKSARMSVERLCTYLMVSNEGLFGTALNCASQFMFVFVIFGNVFSFIGAGNFFVDIAFAAFGRVRGGPAQASVFSSMLMGMISGSGPANVVTTGSITIPLMKKTGFDANTAGAVEAVASNGGQLMPPVMGAVAFLMANATGYTYAEVSASAFLPAVLYYICCSASIFCYSCRRKIPVADKEEGRELWSIFKSGWYYFIPVLVLIGLLATGLSAQRAALFAIGICFLIGLIKNRQMFKPRCLLKLCCESVDSMIAVAMACFLAGVITGCINITGLGLKISTIITLWSGGNLLVLALMTAVICLVLSMGLPTAACYIVLSVLVAPAMVELGVEKMAAHMFILYFGTISNLTPPVALAIFAAISISGGSMWKTGRQAMKLAAAGFLVPFVFIFDPALLLMGAFGKVVFSVITAIIGCILLAAAQFGWMFRELNRLERLILVPCALSLIVPEPVWLNLAGFAAAAAVLARAFFTREGMNEG